jgi:hydroxypyruvate isomerase
VRWHFVEVVCLQRIYFYFLCRYEAAANAGFKCVEIQFPYEETADRIAEVQQKYKLTQVLINAPGGGN